MSLVKIQGNASGTGEFTIAAPNSNTNRTLTLPDATGTVVVTGGAQTIEFAAGSSSAPSITTTGDTNTGIFFPAADTIAFAEGGAEVARFDSSGNFGIGVTAGAPATGELLVLVNKAIRWMNASSGTEYGDIYTDTSNNMVFRNGSGATERARIDSSGNLLVGTTSVGLQNNMSCGFVGLNTTSYAVINHTSGTGGGNYYAAFGYNGSAIGSITQNGTTGVSYNTSSDYRLKNTIAPMTGALEKVAALKPVTYKWNADNSDGQGFIAHELAEVVPDAVTGEKDAVDAEGNPQYQGVDTSFLVATLTAAIQELKAELDTVKAQNAAFEARLAALEAK